MAADARARTWLTSPPRPRALGPLSTCVVIHPRAVGVIFVAAHTTRYRATNPDQRTQQCVKFYLNSPFV